MMEKPNNYFFENNLLRYESYLKGFTSSIFNELNSKFEELDINSKIEDLFAGKNVNFTEDQAAWHYNTEQIHQIGLLKTYLSV